MIHPSAKIHPTALVADGAVIGEDVVIGPFCIIEGCVEIKARTVLNSHIVVKGDTVIGEDGGSLSAGQKQLLCITRVMLCLPPMLILDEATSSIDTRTEQQIQEAFDKLMKGRTSFIVAHRLSTIRNASLILVMKDGKIIEQGTHEELLAQGGFYNKLYNSQFQAV